MSFVRFGPWSQVYVYESLSGIECCGCLLSDDRRTVTKTNDEMVAHLRQHRDAGHLVPDRAFEALEDDDG